MRYGSYNGPEYDEPDHRPAPDLDGYIHRTVTVDHQPELDHLHAAIHDGACGLIARYHHHPQFTALVLHARRILEHDAHNATPELRDRYITDLHHAIDLLAGNG